MKRSTTLAMVLATLAALTQCPAAVSSAAAKPFDLNSFNVRPKPSEDLHIVDLIEPKSEINDPPQSELNNELGLLMKLGDDFAPKFMSIDEPKEVLRPFVQAPSDKISKEIKRMDLSELEEGGPFAVSKRARKNFRKWIFTYTHCAVNYTWKDLGIRFWPQWIRIGECNKKTSCSIPAGQYCRPKESKYLTLLRWHNQGWIKARYPIITQCSCECEN